MATQSTSSRLGVVGKDRNQDGKLNNRDKKRAIVLSPFRWEFGADDEGEMLSDWLKQTRGYQDEGSVQYLEDSAAGVGAFMEWDEFDVIHVSSHGAVLCQETSDVERGMSIPRDAAEGDCWISIWTGTKVDVGLDESTDQPLRVIGAWPNVPGLEVSIDCEKRWVQEYETDDAGDVVQDRDGNPVIRYAKDENGEYALDEDGDKVPMGDHECIASRASAYISLTPEFFHSRYPNGLERSVVFLNACESKAAVGARNSLSISLLAGSGDALNALLTSDRNGRPIVEVPIRTMLFGWDEPTLASDAYRAAKYLYEETLATGLSARSAYRKLVDRGWHISNDLQTGTKAKLWLRPGTETGDDPKGVDLRLRDVVFLADPDGEPLEDHTEMSDMLDGTPGDGTPDALELAVAVDGVQEGEEAKFKVRFELDGNPIGGVYDLSSAKRVPIPPSSYSFSTPVAYVLDDLSVKTGLDLKTNRTYDLEAIVELPEGGESRYEAIELHLFGCSWEAWVEGKHIVAEEGDKATFARMPGGMIVIGLEQTRLNGGIGFHILEGAPRAGETGSFKAMVTGGSLGVPDGQVFGPHESGQMASVFLMENSEDVIRGTGEGPVTVVSGGPGGVNTRTVQVKTKFNIRRDPSLSGLGASVASRFGMDVDDMGCWVGG